MRRVEHPVEPPRLEPAGIGGGARGVAQEVKFPAQITLDGGLLRGRAQLTFKQSSFGYQPYRAVLGTIKNKDEVILHIDLGAKAP